MDREQEVDMVRHTIESQDFAILLLSQVLEETVHPTLRVLDQKGIAIFRRPNHVEIQFRLAAPHGAPRFNGRRGISRYL
jgi:hypothetical protein